MSYVCHPVICYFDRISNLEVRIFAIVYFQLRKREFDWSTFFVGPIRDLVFPLKKGNKYSYLKIQNLVKSPYDIPRILGGKLMSYCESAQYC